MPSNTYLNLSGLWSRDTQRGQVLSAKLTDATRKIMVDALMEGGEAELVVFTSDRRDGDNPKAPTHKLVLSRKVN